MPPTIRGTARETYRVRPWMKIGLEVPAALWLSATHKQEPGLGRPGLEYVPALS